MAPPNCEQSDVSKIASEEAKDQVAAEEMANLDLARAAFGEVRRGNDRYLHAIFEDDETRIPEGRPRAATIATVPRDAPASGDQSNGLEDSGVDAPLIGHRPRSYSVRERPSWLKKKPRPSNTSTENANEPQKREPAPSTSCCAGTHDFGSIVAHPIMAAVLSNTVNLDCFRRHLDNPEGREKLQKMAEKAFPSCSHSHSWLPELPNGLSDVLPEVEQSAARRELPVLSPAEQLALAASDQRALFYIETGLRAILESSTLQNATSGSGTQLVRPAAYRMEGFSSSMQYWGYVCPMDEFCYRKVPIQPAIEAPKNEKDRQK
ncbi:hypothetical protein L3Y34_011205 [Caenorhabditis briggsae]|uniref:Uncharacterized protein n=1 Tax=Caenorhabditis briggsae TaxID=6238 RepID=A0AAE8ZPC7_CAEBR|nr:hypothetical protein L3Y34_011205 [Caenorhabditis briggsae]